ncbi:hypothetical protein DVH24_018941 [Malus domestica]|uniref:Uncharacterized protein n=1 Tax=Malus domestica TaxID=3750 RepID=A0A498HJE2_MALDO|nr:hypothetical protein DVH24_018941 [Malus domestica]
MHEMKKKEKEYIKLQERLNQVLMEKKKESRSGMEIMNLLQVDAYEAKNQELMAENSDLKALLRSMQDKRKKKGRTQCTRLPLYAGSGRGECRLALPPFMERLLPSLEPETYRSWAKALAIAPNAT